MDGGSSLNLLYLKTLNRMGVARSRICTSHIQPFHGVVPDAVALPLGQVTMPVCFGEPANFRVEDLTFEVVDLDSRYEAVFGHPAFVQFGAISNYSDLKLKLPRPNGMIVVGGGNACPYPGDLGHGLLACIQEKGEPLHSFIQHFSQEGVR